DNPHVEIFTPEEGVAVRGFDLEHAIANLQYRDIERSTAEVVNSNGAGFFLVEAIGKRCSGRLIDDAQNFQPGDLACVFRRLSLAVVEISGHGDYRLGH